jgi:Kef-type K+ transport system membrane component KefB
MAYLFFVAGMEIDLKAIAGAPINRAFVAWAGAFALSCLAALAMRAAGLVDNWVIVAIALSTVALGVLVPILKDAALMDSPFGRHVMAAGALGEIAPILAMSLALSVKQTADVQTGFMLAFVAVVLVAGFALMRGAELPGVLGFLRKHLTRSSQLPVRIVSLLVAVFAIFAESLGLDLALGALAAGMVVSLATRDSDVEVLHHKVDAIGFGFLIPIFFIVSGMKLEVAAMFRDTSGLVLAAAFFAATLAIRFGIALLRRDVGTLRERAALGLFSATTLPLVVALAEIGTEGGFMSASQAAPLVGGAMVTVLLFPPIALRLIGRKGSGKVHDRESL